MSSVVVTQDVTKKLESNDTTLYIGYTAIGYGAKSVKGWVLGCPDLPTVNLIGYNAKNRLQCGVKSVITRI